MPPGKRKSPFIGRTEPEGTPILYQRYTKVADILQDTPSLKITPKFNEQIQSNDSIEDQQPVQKKAKKEKKPKSLHADAPGAEVSDALPVSGPSTEETDGIVPETNGNGTINLVSEKKRKPRKKKGKQNTTAAPSGPSNAEEAQAIRGVLGFANQEESAKPSGKFGFNFDAEKDGAAPDKNPITSPTDNVDPPESNGNTEATANATNGSEEITDSKVRRLMGLDPLHVPRRIFVGGMPFHYEEEDVREYWSYCGEIEDVDLMRFPDTGRFKGIAFITFVEYKYDLAKSQEEAVESPTVWAYNQSFETEPTSKILRACMEKTCVVHRVPHVQDTKVPVELCNLKEAGFKEALKYNGEFIDSQQLKVEKCVSDGKKERHPKSDKPNRKQFQQPAPKTEGYNVAYVGNVAFDAGPAQLTEIFQGCRVSFVRLHTDKETRKPKGFAHVHFEDEESLDKAMEFNGARLLGRPLKVGYAQPKK